jgi:hypothetical protein
MFPRLGNPRGAILDGIRLGWEECPGVDGLVVGLDDLDVWRGVLVVVWLYMRRNDVLCLEVVLAYEWRGLVAFVEGGGTAE